MYYVNHEQIDLRLNFLPVVVSALRELERKESGFTMLDHFAQERALHLAIEAVTDVGSYMIDAFIMRDPSSYEDILSILQDEKVYTDEVYHTLTALVKLRRPLVQEFFEWERVGKHELLKELPDALEDFADSVRSYLEKEKA
ncbi:hypothetical protein SY83_20945 [Paenibacillus swuensis]|uniref:DUF86 domain-containing protein n=1 Tax=Paenibacillus swuensis TaxID=1178515 RepID=A0A172TMM9_9BACL|nr:HepT-like ribonuclease domain-containing protein [Paenibacillus swuensis]ANE48339.1 hypothetical protein SY83_20945 [Paenibacillus swuensis]